MWPPAWSDFLYSDIELFGLSDFGFLASLLLRIWPLAIDSSIPMSPIRGADANCDTLRRALPQSPVQVFASTMRESEEDRGLKRAHPSRRQCCQWPRPIPPRKSTAKRRFWPSSRLP